MVRATAPRLSPGCVAAAGNRLPPEAPAPLEVRMGLQWVYMAKNAR
jgi:hypothetical protein